MCRLMTVLILDVEVQMISMEDEGRLIACRDCGKVMVLGQRDRVDHDQTPETWQQARQVEVNAEEVLDRETETDQLVGAYRQYQEIPGCDHVSDFPNQI